MPEQVPKPTPHPPSVDPRVALAQQYLESARADLEASAPTRSAKRSRRPTDNRLPDATWALLRPSVEPTVFVHLLLLSLLSIAVLLALLVCYVLLNQAFTAGRVIAIPVGVLTAIGLSYASAIYLGVIESTSRGATSVDYTLRGDWRDWFWTLPATFGMMALAAFVGFGISRVAPSESTIIVLLVLAVLYPVLQLSTLETGSPLQPFSVPILQSLGKHPLAWLLFLGASAGLLLTTAQVARFVWRDPPYGTMVIMGPVLAFVLLFYGWMLGKLARSLGKEINDDEE